MNLKIYVPFYLSWWFIIICITALSTIAYLIFRWRLFLLEQKNIRNLEKERLKIKALGAELKAIRSQMNPHLIFNSLSSIQTKVLSNQTREAYEHLVVFSRLLRQALDYSAMEYISLEEELNFLKNYIELEFLRKDKSFQFYFDVDESLDLKNEQIPSLLLQPFAENAILHGLMHKEGDKILSVSVFSNENGYSVEILDNGIGRQKSAEINKQKRAGHKSFATKAIEDRLSMLNQSGILKVEVGITDLEVGTKVIINICKNESNNR